MATFKSSGTDKDVKIQPTGTGKVVVGTGAAAATVASDGDNDLVLQTGNAITGSITITDGANGNIAITPNGTGEVALPKVNIDGGAIDGVTIGGSSAGAVTTSSLVATTADINGGTIDGTTIGGTTPAAVTTSSLVATTADINGGTIDGTDITIGSGKTLDVSAGTFTASSINDGQLGGFRNLIINGNFQVNQRGAASRTATSSAYNYDRWYYDGTDLYQVIEGQNVRAVLHAISWSGSGLTAAWVSSANTTASIPTGFTTITSGSTFTPTASTNLWIKFSGTLANLANLAEVQVEAGSTATAFEHRPYGIELALCQRYYQLADFKANLSSYTANARIGGSITFPVTMRVAPTIGTTTYYGSNSQNTSAAIAGPTEYCVRAIFTFSAAATNYECFAYAPADAEL